MRTTTLKSSITYIGPETEINFYQHAAEHPVSGPKHGFQN